MYRREWSRRKISGYRTGSECKNSLRKYPTLRFEFEIPTLLSNSKNHKTKQISNKVKAPHLHPSTTASKNPSGIRKWATQQHKRPHSIATALGTTPGKARVATGGKFANPTEQTPTGSTRRIQKIKRDDDDDDDDVPTPAKIQTLDGALRRVRFPNWNWREAAAGGPETANFQLPATRVNVRRQRHLLPPAKEKKFPI